jgi:hypothetical protein
MARIIQWTEAELSRLGEIWGLLRILTEVADDGSVMRELGFDAEGNVVHRFPGEPTRADYADYGVFDLATIDPSGGADMDAAEFERLWSA